MVDLMTANHDLSLRKALAYTDCSRNTYYYNKKKGPRNTRQQQHQQQQQHHLIQTVLEKKVEEIILQRPSYGTRRMAAILTRVIGKSINRKRVQKLYHKLNLTIPSKKKREIIRSKHKEVKNVYRPNEVWEVDLTYVHCGIDGWGYLFNVFDIFTREWVGYCFDLSAVKENAIISIENALVTHKEIVPDNDNNNNNKPTIRADNGSQYTSNAFRKSMSVLGLKLEHIACNTPEQNGHIESFHKTLKKEYIWPYDFRTYQEAEVAIRDAFVDYNQNRIHSSLGYLTPYEFISNWKQEHQRETEEVAEQQSKV
ncbi:MAG: IS3 family transposase, partial [Nitrososphaeraceae archaeon]